MEITGTVTEWNIDQTVQVNMFVIQFVYLKKNNAIEFES